MQYRNGQLLAFSQNSVQKWLQYQEKHGDPIVSSSQSDLFWSKIRCCKVEEKFPDETLFLLEGIKGSKTQHLIEEISLFYFPGDTPITNHSQTSHSRSHPIHHSVLSSTFWYRRARSSIHYIHIALSSPSTHCTYIHTSDYQTNLRSNNRRFSKLEDILLDPQYQIFDKMLSHRAGL